MQRWWDEGCLGYHDGSNSGDSAGNGDDGCEVCLAVYHNKDCNRPQKIYSDVKEMNWFLDKIIMKWLNKCSQQHSLRLPYTNINDICIIMTQQMVCHMTSVPLGPKIQR